MFASKLSSKSLSLFINILLTHTYLMDNIAQSILINRGPKQIRIFRLLTGVHSWMSPFQPSVHCFISFYSIKASPFSAPPPDHWYSGFFDKIYGWRSCFGVHTISMLWLKLLSELCIYAPKSVPDPFSSINSSVKTSKLLRPLPVGVFIPLHGNVEEEITPSWTTRCFIYQWKVNYNQIIRQISPNNFMTNLPYINFWWNNRNMYNCVDSFRFSVQKVKWCMKHNKFKDLLFKTLPA